MITFLVVATTGRGLNALDFSSPDELKNEILRRPVHKLLTILLPLNECANFN